MIYVIGLDSDPTLLHFLAGAQQRGARVQLVNLREVARTEWRFSLPDDGGTFVSVAGERLLLDPNASYFCRLIDLSSVQPDAAQAKGWRGLMAALSAWLEHIPGVVINRPGFRCDNGSKPLHAHFLQQQGLRVPESLASSDPACLRSFAERSATVVKPLSGVRAECRLVEPSAFLDFDPAGGPVYLQRYVPGDDVRAHVVGATLHGERIRSRGVDYRAATGPVDYAGFELPPDLAEVLLRATCALGLTFAGWDFKVTEEEEFFCLEANPMPGYDGYDRRLGGCITASLLRVLQGKGSAPPRREAC